MKMSKRKFGLYTNGKTVVSLYDDAFGDFMYQRERPYSGVGKSISPEDFAKKYPYKVTKVEVVKGAKKETGRVKPGLYTNGKSVVCVHDGGYYQINYTLEIPFREKDCHTSAEKFLKKYPYRLDGVELE